MIKALCYKTMFLASEVKMFNAARSMVQSFEFKASRS